MMFPARQPPDCILLIEERCLIHRNGDFEVNLWGGDVIFTATNSDEDALFLQMKYGKFDFHESYFYKGG